MAWREVRRRHKLVFRYEPYQNLIEVKVEGRLEVIRLDDYLPAPLRKALEVVTVGPIDEAEWCEVCNLPPDICRCDGD